MIGIALAMAVELAVLLGFFLVKGWIRAAWWLCFLVITGLFFAFAAGASWILGSFMFMPDHEDVSWGAVPITRGILWLVKNYQFLFPLYLITPTTLFFDLYFGIFFATIFYGNPLMWITMVWAVFMVWQWWMSSKIMDEYRVRSANNQEITEWYLERRKILYNHSWLDNEIEDAEISAAKTPPEKMFRSEYKTRYPLVPFK